MFYVKVHGETLGDLKLGLLAKLNEIDGRSVKTVREFGVVNEGSSTGEEMEEVESPYAGTATSSIDTSIVVDNEKDVEGLPWDSRIHSGGKSKNKDGSWKAKKGVDAALALQVKAELLQRGATVAPVVAPMMLANSAPSQVITPVQQPVQAPVQIPSAVLPAPTSGHTLQSFQASFALIMSNLITQGKLTQDYINTLNAHFKIAAIYEATPEMQEACFNEFVNCGIITKVG